MSIGWLLIGLAGVLAGISVLLWRRALYQSLHEQVVGRMGLATPEWKPGRGWELLELVLLRAGLIIPRTRIQAVIYGWLACLVVAQLLGGWLATLVLLVVPALVVRAYLSWRAQAQIRRMVAQLPSFLDQILRSLQAGRTFGDATIRSIEASPEPLHSALGRVQRSVVLGVALPDAMREAAELYDQNELRILALGMQVNHQYGGSASELLNSLITVLNERELIARQLRAMTGETRMTAVVLAVLPVGMAGYMMAVNPQYILSMWNDSSGQQMLLAAFILQALGCVMLWRMLRSV